MASTTKPKARREPARCASLEEMLARLTKSQQRGSLVVSCYIKLGVQERLERRCVSELRSRIHDLTPQVRSQVSSHAEREALLHDFDRILGYCDQHGPLPNCGGLAFFASERDELFEVFALPYLHRFRLVFDRTPFVRPLVELRNEFGRVLAAVADRARARVFEVTAFGAKEIIDLTAWSTRGGRYHSDRQGAPGWGEQTYHNRIQTEKDRHYHAVSVCLNDLAQAKPIKGIALFGQGTAAHDIGSFLPPSLSTKMLGTGILNPKTVSPNVVYESTATLAAENAIKKNREMLTEYGEAFGAGLAVEGIRETLKALYRGQVRSLFIVEDAIVSGFLCSGSGHLVLTPDECDGQDEIQPAPYLIDDMLEEAIRQDVALNFVPAGNAAAIDTMGAILRFQ